MSKAFLVPKPGYVVRDPRTRQPLPAEGAEMELDSYWLRRLADGDVGERQSKAQPPKPPVAKRAAEPTPEE